MRDWLPERLPEDIEAERSLLATCCAPGAQSQAEECMAVLTEADFVHPAHRAVFRALLSILSAGEEIHALSLKAALEDMGVLGRVGGYPGLVELLAGEDVGRPLALAKRLRMLRQFRDAIRAGANLVRQAVEQAEEPGALLSATIDRLVTIGQEAQPGAGLREIDAYGDGVERRLVEIAEGRATPGISTGFPRLDTLLGGGFKPGQLIVLAARPGVGKSTLAQGFAIHAAQRHGRTAIWSLEMTGDELFGRMAASRAGIPSNVMSFGSLEGAQWAAFRRARAELRALPLYIDDLATTNVPLLRGGFDRASARGGSFVLGVVDYLQLMKNASGSAAAKQNEAVRVGEITRDLKLMAKDRGLPLIVLSQMNREVEHRTAGRPQLSDLRDSGAIEQDADVVLFIHRNITPSLEGTPVDLSAELIVAKQRNGPTGIVKLQQDLEHFRFVESTRETPPPSYSATPDHWAGYQS